MTLLIRHLDDILINLSFQSQVSGTPANIVKPYSVVDMMCPAQDINTNSVYKSTDSTSNDIDRDDSIYADSGRGKVTRHSPTYSLELSSSSSKPNGRHFSVAVAMVVVVLSQLNMFMWSEFSYESI